jgi:uncharacterized protein (DUF3084 family)
MKIKRIRLPLNKMTKEDQHYAAVLLEDVQENFKAFGEALETVRGDLNTVKSDLNTVKTDLNTVKSDLNTVKTDLKAVKKKTNSTFEEVGKIKVQLTGINLRLGKIEQEVRGIKKEIKDLRISLSRKADIKRLEALERRIVLIERHLKLSTPQYNEASQLAN